MIYREGIEKGFKEGQKEEEIARKIFLSYPTFVFRHDKEEEYKIKNEISKFFNIPFRNVQVVGSAKTGESYIKNTFFRINESDLDIAIIDLQMFYDYMEKVFKATKGYSDLTGFSTPKSHLSYEKYLAKGIFRPDFMPKCEARTVLRKFLNNLSSNHAQKFSNINVAIYASECFFESKQGKIIKGLKNTK